MDDPVHAALFDAESLARLTALADTDPSFVVHDFADPAAYLAFVASHAEVHTDSLHIAVCGLIARRRVTPGRRWGGRLPLERRRGEW